MRSQTTIEMDAINVLIIDDHKMVRDGIKVMLTSLHKEIQLKVTEAESGEDGLKKMSHSDFELVILDYQLPGLSGAETAQRILRFKPDTKILALSNYNELANIENMIDAGALGYVLKNIEPAEMLKAIRTVFKNKLYYCNEVSLKIIEGAANCDYSKAGKYNLTERELEILRLIAMEYTNTEIARKLFLSKRTIDSHRQNLINKLHAKNTVGLLKAALKMGIVN